MLSIQTRGSWPRWGRLVSGHRSADGKYQLILLRRCMNFYPKSYIRQTGNTLWQSIMAFKGAQTKLMSRKVYPEPDYRCGGLKTGQDLPPLPAERNLLWHTARTGDFATLQFFHLFSQIEIASAGVHKKGSEVREKSPTKLPKKWFDWICFQNMAKVLHWVGLCVALTALNLIEMCVIDLTALKLAV